MVQLVCQNDIIVSHPFACHCQATLNDVAAKDYQRTDGSIHVSLVFHWMTMRLKYLKGVMTVQWMLPLE